MAMLFIFQKIKYIITLHSFTLSCEKSQVLSNLHKRKEFHYRSKTVTAIAYSKSDQTWLL